MKNNLSTSTMKFAQLNFNLKKIIFEFLNINDLKGIYWTRKELRSLLKATPLSINISSFKKRATHQFEYDRLFGILNLSDDTIAFWTEDSIILLKYNEKEINPSTEVIKSFPFEYNNSLYMCIFPIQLKDPTNINTDTSTDIIFTDGQNELKIFDKNFKLIDTYYELNTIISLCIISSCSFAVGLSDGSVKIYFRNEKKYQVHRKYNCYKCPVNCILYLPKQDFILFCIYKYIEVFNLKHSKHIVTLDQHNHELSSIIQMNDNIFVSVSSDGEIKFWCIKSEKNYIIECINTIKAYEQKSLVFLYVLGDEYIVSRQFKKREFKIWDVKNYKCINTYKEESYIKRLIVTKNNNIITGTFLDRKVNVWKILE